MVGRWGATKAKALGGDPVWPYRAFTNLTSPTICMDEYVHEHSRLVQQGERSFAVTVRSRYRVTLTGDHQGATAEAVEVKVVSVLEQTSESGSGCSPTWIQRRQRSRSRSKEIPRSSRESAGGQSSDSSSNYWGRPDPDNNKRR